MCKQRADDGIVRHNYCLFYNFKTKNEQNECKESKRFKEEKRKKKTWKNGEIYAKAKRNDIKLQVKKKCLRKKNNFKVNK